MAGVNSGEMTPAQEQQCDLIEHAIAASMRVVRILVKYYKC